MTNVVLRGMYALNRRPVINEAHLEGVNIFGVDPGQKYQAVMVAEQYQPNREVPYAQERDRRKENIKKLKGSLYRKMNRSVWSEQRHSHFQRVCVDPQSGNTIAEIAEELRGLRKAMSASMASIVGYLNLEYQYLDL